MRGYSMLAVMERLGVKPSFSRPYLSTDNAYAESMFKTMKYGPLYPQRPFIDLEAAKGWMKIFVHWYNETHLGYVTPNQRHSLQSDKILEKRNEVYRAAKEQSL